MGIVIGAFVLNMVPVPFERALVDCFEYTKEGIALHKMIVTTDVANTPLYGVCKCLEEEAKKERENSVVHLVPDLIFRAPTPIVFMAVLTVRTIQK